MRRTCASTLPAAALLLAGCHPPPPPPAWATVVAAGASRGASLLRFYDPETLNRIADLPLPGMVVTIAPNPVLPQFEALSAGPNALVEVDSERRGVVSTIALPATPSAIAFSRDGRRVVVSAGHDLLAIDLASHAILTRTPVGASLNTLAFTPDDTRLAGADAAGSALRWFDPDRLTQTATTPLAAPPLQLLVLGYGRKAFALCPARNRIAVVDTVSGQLLTYLPVGPEPSAMLFKPDGGELYVANRGGGTVSVINTGTNEVSGTMWAGKGPAALAISDDGTLLYVANSDANTVTGLGTEERRPYAGVNVGQQPMALALGPRSNYLFAADAGSGDIAVLHADLANPDHRNLVNLLPAPPAARLLAVLK